MAQILKEHKVESKEFLAKELFNERKFDKAFPLTLEADQSDPQIIYNLGFMYYFGKGVKRDRKKGMLLVKKTYHEAIKVAVRRVQTDKISTGPAE